MSAFEERPGMTEQEALAEAERRRWGDMPRCPRCLSDAVYRMKANRPLWRCIACNKQQFTVRIGTALEDSPIPVRGWLEAELICRTSEWRGSATRIEAAVGVQYTTALRVREQCLRWITVFGGIIPPVDTDILCPPLDKLASYRYPPSKIMNRLSRHTRERMVTMLIHQRYGIRATARTLNISKVTVFKFVRNLYYQAKVRGWKPGTIGDFRSRTEHPRKFHPEGKEKRTPFQLLKLRIFDADGHDLLALLPWIEAEENAVNVMQEPKEWRPRPFKPLDPEAQWLARSRILLSTARRLVRESARTPRV